MKKLNSVQPVVAKEEKTEKDVFEVAHDFKMTLHSMLINKNRENINYIRRLL
jgi:hypothetical protein